MTLTAEQESLMRWILFWVFLVIFVAVVAGTLGALFFNFGYLEDVERNTLFTAFIVEVGAAIIALFYSIFRLRRTGTAASRLRLSLEEFADVRQLIGKTAVLWPSREDLWEGKVLLESQVPASCLFGLEVFVPDWSPEVCRGIELVKGRGFESCAIGCLQFRVCMLDK